VISQTKASVVTVGVGTTLNDLVINLPLPLTFNVSGRVLRNDHERGMIRLTRDSQPFLEAGYASDGSFEFAKLPRGSYVLDVDRKARMTVNVDDHDIAGLEIAVPGTPDVTGVIIVEDGAPIPNLMLQFSGSLGVTGIAPLAEGAFAVRLRPGSYRLAVTGLPAGYEVKSIKEGAIDLLKEPLVVAPSVPTSDPAPPRVTVALGIDSRSRWVQITGRLKTTDIPAAARTKIGLAGKPFLEMVVSSVQEDGSFVFPLVLPGEYTLSLVPDSGFYRKVPVGADGLSDFVLEFNASDLHVR
jgi:hypothetical protein